MNAGMLKHMAEFGERYGLTAVVPYRILDLVPEIGELSKEILKATAYCKHEFRPGEDWEAELGDVLFSSICRANSTGVDLEQA